LRNKFKRTQRESAVAGLFRALQCTQCSLLIGSHVAHQSGTDASLKTELNLKPPVRVFF
jgi:hypothetical protein